MVDPKIVFPEIEQAEPDPDFPILRPGGGPVAAGAQVLLSDLYDPAQLQPGQKFGLFLIAQGFTLNGDDLSGDLHFASDGRTLLTADGQPIAGNVFFTTDPTPGSPNDNPLNPDGLGHVVSGLLPDHAGLTIGFEDKLLGNTWRQRLQRRGGRRPAQPHRSGGICRRRDPRRPRRYGRRSRRRQLSAAPRSS